MLLRWLELLAMAVRSALLDASASAELLLWLCDQLYSMLLRWLELLAMAVRSALLDASAIVELLL